MRALPVAELKARFSKVLHNVRRGERIGILYGRSKTPVAMIVPWVPARAGRRDLGLLDGEITIEFADDFEMTEEEFLGSA